MVGIAELMNFPGVLAADPAVLAKAELGLQRGVPIDGHAPGVTGKDLCAYVAAGIESDHETTRAEEAEEKLRLGLWLMVREGSTEHNLAELLPVVRRLRARRALFVTDDRAPNDLLHQGHLDHAVRLAIAEGLDPVSAIAMATINPAERFGLQAARRDRAGLPRRSDRRRRSPGSPGEARVQGRPRRGPRRRRRPSARRRSTTRRRSTPSTSGRSTSAAW